MIQNRYTEDQEIWLREHYKEYGKHRVCAAFNEVFSTNKSTDAIWHKVRKLGLSGNGTDYKQEMCKKHFSVPIGTEYIDSNGYTLVKVYDKKNGKSKNWKTKQSVIWEKSNGEIPKGFSIMFLDGNKSNFELSNLLCVKTGRITTLVKKGWYGENPELNMAGILWAELYSLVGEGTRIEETYRDESLFVN